MPSKLYSTAICDKLVNQNVSSDQQECLVFLFGNVIKRMATTLARKSYYHLADFHGTKDRGIEGFDLEITLHSVCIISNTSQILKHFQQR